MDDNSKTPQQATPHGTLLEQIMDPCQPKTEREWAAKREIERLQDAIRQTLDENRHLADGENCTLLVLKRALPDNAKITGG